ncbi:hypothetical protein D3C85_1685960 [compost metagenome]
MLRIFRLFFIKLREAVGYKVPMRKGFPYFVYADSIQRIRPTKHVGDRGPVMLLLLFSIELLQGFIYGRPAVCVQFFFAHMISLPECGRELVYHVRFADSNGWC